MKYRANPVEVDAWVITAVKTYIESTNHFLTLRGETTDVAVGPEMTARMKPVPGDYYVKQADGYVYLNPKEVFERKYSALPEVALVMAPQE